MANQPMGPHRPHDAILRDIDTARSALPPDRARYGELVAELHAEHDHMMSFRRAEPGYASPEGLAAGRAVVARMVDEWLEARLEA